MRKIILIILILLVATPIFAEEFCIYGVDPHVSQKYIQIFQTPQFEYMGGAAFGDYVYVITLISKDEKYYCTGIVTDNLFNDIVQESGKVELEINEYEGKKSVRLSYRPVVLIEMPFGVE